MIFPQTITIPQQLSKNEDFALRISQNNQKIYSHIEYLKHLVQSMYQMYRKTSKSIIKLSQQYEKRLLKQNDSTALSIINFIKGIQKLFINIKQQICNNTVNMNKKNQKVSKTRKDIIHQKLTKIYQLFVVYLQKVHKYNTSYKQYEHKCQYFVDIQKDVIKFYSTKANKLLFEQLQKKQSTIQQQLQQTYSLKIQLKSGLCEIRLSLKQFFQMLSNNAEDDKKLLLAVRKRLKQTKIFNQTIIEEVNSQAQESVVPVGELQWNKYGGSNNSSNSYSNSGNGNNNNRHKFNYGNNNNDDDIIVEQQHQNNQAKQQQHTHQKINPQQQQKLFNNINNIQQAQTQSTFFSFNKFISIDKDVKQLIANLNAEQYCIESFCQFIQCFQREIIQNAQVIDKLRNTEEFQKFIDKKFQINELLTNDMVYNIEAIKNQIADIRQIIQSIKALLDKKKVINQLKKYRAMKSQKFLSQCEVYIEHEKKFHRQEKSLFQVRLKYKEQKQKFAKGHLQLMRRFRQMVQDMFRQINQKFKFQRNPQMQSKKTKNQFIQKKYFSLLMLNFFVNKQEPPKFQMNTHLKNYQKYLSQENLKKIGLSSSQGEMRDSGKKKGWGCCDCLISTQKKKSQKNKYIDEYNCALRQGLVLIQGKMKIHPNYLKFVSSFNAKTFFGETNLRIPKWDIDSIDKQYVLLSLVIVVKTVRGKLPFTSFLSDPYRKLTDVYENKQPLLLRKNTMTGTNKNIHSSMMNSGSNNEERKTNNNANALVINTPFDMQQNQHHNNIQSETFTVNNNNKMLTSSKKTKNNNKSKIYYMTDIEQKFQSQIPQLIDKQMVSFQSLSTYLSENKKQLSISVQYHLLANPDRRYFFEIKVMDSSNNNKIQYKFVHEKAMEDQGVKRMLQEMATMIINSKIQPRTPKTPKTPNNFKNSQKFTKLTQSQIIQENQPQQKQQRQQQQEKCSFFQKCPITKLFEGSSYSFIQRRQNNQFQFDKDPSFVYVKQPSIANGGQQPSFNYIPDLQIFKNMNSQRKLTYQQQRRQLNSSSRQEKQRSFGSKDNKSIKSQNGSISKQDIDQYLNSIDESTIKKNLFLNKKDYSNNKTLKKQALTRQRQQSSKTRNEYIIDGNNNKESRQQKNCFVSVNVLVLVLIVILVMNVIVSIFEQ